MKSNKVKSTHALCAQAIRAELKTAFPGTTFTVKSETFAGGDAVNIGYLDGPLYDAVEAITSKYQFGHFNGQEDIYEYSNKIEGLPQVKFVSVTRRPSDSTKELIAAELGITDENRNDWFEADHCYQYERIYRTFVQRDYSQNKGGTGSVPPTPENTPTPDDNTPGPGNTTETLLPIEDEGIEIPGVTLVVKTTGAEVDLVTELFDKEPDNAVPVTGKVLFMSVNNFLNNPVEDRFPLYSDDQKAAQGLPGDRERLLSGTWVDTSFQYPNNITFDQVYAKHPDGQILRVSEFFCGDNWHPIGEVFTEVEAEIWSPAEMIQRLVDTWGAVAFCIEIEDRFGRVKNPDFKIEDLLPG